MRRRGLASTKHLPLGHPSRSSVRTGLRASSSRLACAGSTTPRRRRKQPRRRGMSLRRIGRPGKNLRRRSPRCSRWSCRPPPPLPRRSSPSACQGQGGTCSSIPRQHRRRRRRCPVLSRRAGARVAGGRHRCGLAAYATACRLPHGLGRGPGHAQRRPGPRQAGAHAAGRQCCTPPRVGACRCPGRLRRAGARVAGGRRPRGRHRCTMLRRAAPGLGRGPEHAQRIASSHWSRPRVSFEGAAGLHLLGLARAISCKACGAVGVA